MKTISCLLILLAEVTSFSCSDSPSTSSSNINEQQHSPSPWVMQEKYFFSSFVEDTIKLDISVPPDYEYKTAKNYNVIYFTDGYWRKANHDTIHQMGQNGEIQELIIVGIGYPDYYDFNSIRSRDLVINADKLLLCIRKEIIPYIENNFRANSTDRTLYGTSYGGYFVIYALTEHEKSGRLFKTYIASSVVLNPPLAHVDIMKNEDSLWNTTRELPVNLYLTVGGNEDQANYMIGQYETIKNRMLSHPYQGLRFDYEIIPNLDHYHAWKPTLFNGLKMYLQSN